MQSHKSHQKIRKQALQKRLEITAALQLKMQITNK
jgi:hypothetical protein